MKYAVVSGGGSGIGEIVLKRLQSQGYNVICIDLKNADITADLSTPEGRSIAVSETLEACGHKIDRLVLAAGLGGHLKDGALVARVNYFGAVALLDGFKNALAETHGRCVVIGSNSSQMRIDPNSPIVDALLEGDENKAMGVIGDAPATGVYGNSKHALTRAVRRRAAEWGHAGISINVIAPGPTQTAMLQGVIDDPVISKSLDMIPIPKKRFGTAEEMADIIEFLLSDTADYMQGSVIYVDGGTDAQLRPDAF